MDRVDECIRIASQSLAANEFAQGQAYAVLGLLILLADRLPSGDRAADDVLAAIAVAADEFFTHPSDGAFQAVSGALDEWNATRGKNGGV